MGIGLLFHVAVLKDRRENVQSFITQALASQRAQHVRATTDFTDDTDKRRTVGFPSVKSVPSVVKNLLAPGLPPLQFVVTGRKTLCLRKLVPDALRGFSAFAQGV